MTTDKFDGYLYPRITLTRRQRFSLFVHGLRVRVLCRKLGWHGRYRMRGYDGASFEAQCGYCGFIGKLD